VISRRSHQRDVVLDAVRSTMEHPTADWVYRRARRQLPRISLATVYRNLQQLVDEGLIHELQATGQAARFDANIDRHYHVRCLGCGRINDLPLSVDDGIERRARSAIDYQILGHQVEVHGLCPACQARDGRSEHNFGKARHPKEGR
jgi:Fe2+ or Zn2+ uptake regulation protein